MQASSRHRPRPRSSRLGLVAFGIILLVATLAVPLLAGASEYRTGDTVRLGPTERFTDNVYIAARRVTFDGQAAKDVNVAAANADIGGTVGGSLNLLAGSAEVTTNVTGSIHVAGGTVAIRGVVNGDLLVAGGSVEVTNQARINGDVILAGGRVTLDGTVAGDVYGTTLSFAQEGTVRGDINVQASELDVATDARIGGDLIYQSPQDADIAQPAAVAGAIDRTNAAPWQGIDEGGMRPMGPLLRIAWALVLGAAIVALAPRLANRIAEHGEPFVRPVVIGILALVAIPLATVIALVTIVGIPLGLLLLLGLTLALYLSQVFVGLTLGRYVLPRSWRDGSRGFSLLAMTIGVLVIGGLRLIPFPYVGAAVAFVVAMWGLGAILYLVTDLTPRRARASAA